MKKILIILDGADDLPCPELGGRTPFEAAETPNYDRLAAVCMKSLFSTFDDGTIPGSENAIPSLLGYSGLEIKTVGRGALEALGMGIKLLPGEYAMRCNIVELEADGTYLTDRPEKIDAEEIRNRFSDNFSALRTFGYRIYHLGDLKSVVISKNPFCDQVCPPPHDALLYSIKKWRISQSNPNESMREKALSEIASAIIDIKTDKSTRYFGLWLWGGGNLPRWKPFTTLSGYKNPTAITGTPLVKGIAKAIGMAAPSIPGATGGISTDYEAKAQAAIDALTGGAEFVMIHIEAPDEAGHLGDPWLKKRVIEEIDRRLLGPLLTGLKRHGIETHITITADHPTPCSLRRHTDAPVTSLTAHFNRSSNYNSMLYQDSV